METGQVYGPVFWVRHGQTDYTDVFPDLTDTGKKLLRMRAEEIRGDLSGRHAALITSPTVRTRGSASVIAQVLGYRGKIRIEPDIASAVVRDKIRGMELFNEYVKRGDHDGLAIAYSTDPRYEDPSIFEPRSEVKARFYRYLARVIRRLLRYRPDFCLVHISHYEFLYHFVERVFELDYTKDRPLSFAEMFSIVFCESEYENIVKVSARFRGQNMGGIFFDYKKVKWAYP